MSSKRVWIVYDGRAADGDTMNASIYVTCESEKEARSYVADMFPDGLIYTGNIENGVLSNEQRVCP